MLLDKNKTFHNFNVNELAFRPTIFLLPTKILFTLTEENRDQNHSILDDKLLRQYLRIRNDINNDPHIFDYIVKGTDRTLWS